MLEGVRRSGPSKHQADRKQPGSKGWARASAPSSLLLHPADAQSCKYPFLTNYLSLSYSNRTKTTAVRAGAALVSIQPLARSTQPPPATGKTRRIRSTRKDLASFTIETLLNHAQCRPLEPQTRSKSGKNSLPECL